MTDYRLKPNRQAYFDGLYAMTLEHRVSPGLVYLYLPGLVRQMRLVDEDQAWLAFLNGVTQNPITTMRLFQQLPRCPRPGQDLTAFKDWFDGQWPLLAFDTDRLKNKRLTLDAITSYAELVEAAGGQVKLYAGKTYQQAWSLASNIRSFGRLSAFSYLEYMNLLGLAPAADDLFFGDLEGSRSHRNGMLLLHGLDHLVWDKRMPNGCTGRYKDLASMAAQMTAQADAYLARLGQERPELPDVGNNTCESALCAFKNSFFARRYPGVYADMGWDRIAWYQERGLTDLVKPFIQMREELPDWLRLETEDKPGERSRRARLFAETGAPYRASNFLA